MMSARIYNKKELINKLEFCILLQMSIEDNIILGAQKFRKTLDKNIKAYFIRLATNIPGVSKKVPPFDWK